MKSKIASACFVVFLIAISTCPTVQGFNLGVKGVKCNLVEGIEDINNPCGLYDALCIGKYCDCPAGTHEHPNLSRCIAGAPPKVASGGTLAAAGGDDLFDDELLNYDPNKKNTPKPSAPVIPPPHQPAYPSNPNQPAPGYPNQPAPGYPNQPASGYPNQPRPGYPPVNPNQPGQDRNRPGQKGNQGDDNIGEKAGGGVGGILGLLLLGCLIYFCCCKGGKRKEMMGKFQGIPFIGGGQRAAVPGQAVQMQQSPPVQQDPNFGSQHTYIPPGGVDPGQQYPPQQPYPPPGFVPDGQQPPPYTQQYQPNVPPPQ